MNIDDFYNMSQFDTQYRNFVSDYFYEYERVPNEEESYDFFIRLAKKYNDDAAEEAAVDNYEFEKERDR